MATAMMKQSRKPDRGVGETGRVSLTIVGKSCVSVEWTQLAKRFFFLSSILVFDFIHQTTAPFSLLQSMTNRTESGDK